MIEKLRQFYLAHRAAGFRKQAPALVAQIDTVAESVVGHIEGHFARKVADGRPLYVMLGEVHDRAAHLVMQMVAVKTLMEKGYKVAIGLERTYNSTKVAVEMIPAAHSPLKGHIKGRILQLLVHERDSFLNLELSHTYYKQLSAPVSAVLREAMWTRQGIRVAFNDAARCRNNDNYLDMDDPVLQRAAGDTHPGYSSKKPVKLHHEDGMSLRNRVMVELAQEHAAQRQPDLYLQICGTSHVTGWGKKDESYQRSLTGLFEEAGCSVLGIPVLSSHFGAQDFAPGNPERVAHGHTLNGPMFSGYQAAVEEEWLKVVMPHFDPDFDLKRDLVLCPPRHLAPLWPRADADSSGAEGRTGADFTQGRHAAFDHR